MSLRSTAQPRYTRFPIIFGSGVSKVVIGYNPTLPVQIAASRSSVTARKARFILRAGSRCWCIALHAGSRWARPASGAAGGPACNAMHCGRPLQSWQGAERAGARWKPTGTTIPTFFHICSRSLKNKKKNVSASGQMVPTPRESILHPSRGSQVPYTPQINVFSLFILLYVCSIDPFKGLPIGIPYWPKLGQAGGVPHGRNP